MIRDLKMSEKKVVGRNVAIALGIICVVLAVGLVGAIANYTSIISGKDNAIASLNSQITEKDSEITSLNLQIGNLTSQNSQLRMWLEGNITLLNSQKLENEKLSLWLEGNETLLTQTQTWLQGNITYYESQIATLNSQIDSLNSQIATKDSQISALKSQINSLQSELDSLKAAQLHEVNFNWEWNEPWIGSHYVHVSGAVFNSGTYTARNVRINIWLYDSNLTLIRSDTINLGDISGKTYTNFAIDIYYSGHCAFYSYEITHD